MILNLTFIYFTFSFGLFFLSIFFSLHFHSNFLGTKHCLNLYLNQIRDRLPWVTDKHRNRYQNLRVLCFFAKTKRWERFRGKTYLTHKIKEIKSVYPVMRVKAKCICSEHASSNFTLLITQKIMNKVSL